MPIGRNLSGEKGYEKLQFLVKSKRDMKIGLEWGAKSSDVAVEGRTGARPFHGWKNFDFFSRI